MGLFAGIRNPYRKRDAAVVVQNLFEHLARYPCYDLDPPKLADRLIGLVWDEKPDSAGGSGKDLIRFPLQLRRLRMGLRNQIRMIATTAGPSSSH